MHLAKPVQTDDAVALGFNRDDKGLNCWMDSRRER